MIWVEHLRSADVARDGLSNHGFLPSPHFTGNGAEIEHSYTEKFAERTNSEQWVAMSA